MPLRLDSVLCRNLLIAGSSCLLPILLARYGFEVADSGWAAVLTRDFFDRPEMAGRASPWFLNWALCALITSGETFRFDYLRVAAFAPILTASLFTYLTFHLYGHRSLKVACAVMAAGVVAYGGSAVYFINYNTVSACLIVASISFLLWSGRVASREWAASILCLFGGFFLALSAASRIASAALVLPCIFIIFSIHRSRLQPWVAFFAGAALSAAFLAFVFKETGHLNYILHDLRQFVYSALVSRTNASHTGSNLLKAFLLSLAESMGWAAVVIASLYFVLDGRKSKDAARIAIGAMGVAFMIWTGRKEYIEVLPSLFLMLLLSSARPNRELRPFLLPTAGALLAFAFPLGSTNGFKNSSYALWFLLPGVLTVLTTSRERCIGNIALCFAVAMGIYNSVRNPYWDHSVWSLSCSIQTRFTGSIRTTCDRERVLNELMVELQKRVKPKDEIFVYQNSPMIYILSGTRPWIPYPWPYLVPIEKIETAILEREKVSLPKIVVRDKLSTFNKDWPNTLQPPMETISGGQRYTRFYEDYFEQRRFKKVFENSMYEILATEN
ncbi:MAG TPA: hypothetical protein VFP68_12835 [Burkholderiaceae bacterium]|nr:hypothetical protein [Burkholderiaceae bacterium]